MPANVIPTEDEASVPLLFNVIRGIEFPTGSFSLGYMAGSRHFLNLNNFPTNKKYFPVFCHFASNTGFFTHSEVAD